MTAASSSKACYVLQHSGVEVLIRAGDAMPEGALRLMTATLIHDPMQPIGRRYSPLELTEDGRPAKYDINDKTVLVELVGRTYLIFLPVPSRSFSRAHDNSRNGVARWANLRLDKMAPLQWWLKRRARSSAEVEAYYAVRHELEKLAARHWSRWWYGRRFLDDGGERGQ